MCSINLLLSLHLVKISNHKSVSCSRLTSKKSEGVGGTGAGLDHCPPPQFPAQSRRTSKQVKKKHTMLAGFFPWWKKMEQKKCPSIAKPQSIVYGSILLCACQTRPIVLLKVLQSLLDQWDVTVRPKLRLESTWSNYTTKTLRPII